MIGYAEGDEVGATPMVYACQECGDCGWITNCLLCKGSHCCPCAVGHALAVQMAAREDQALADQTRA